MIKKEEEKKTPVIVDYLRKFEENRAKKGPKPDLYYMNKQLKKNLNNDIDLTHEEQYDEGKLLFQTL